MSNTNKERCGKKFDESEIGYFTCQRHVPCPIHAVPSQESQFADVRKMETKVEDTQPSGEWEKDFKDFYMERGKYEGRPLGPQEYIKFISSLLLTQRSKVQVEDTQPNDLSPTPPLSPNTTSPKGVEPLERWGRGEGIIS